MVSQVGGTRATLVRRFVKLISPESLGTVQREILRGYSRFFPAGAVCVNVMLGEEPWDIRPLVLLNGKVHIVRFSMTLEEQRAQSIATDLEGFSQIIRNGQRVQFLPGEGRFVVIRPFEATTLKEDLEKGVLSGSPALQEVVRSLISIVSDLSRRSLAHGHISPANISRVGSDLVLLDPILGALHHTSDIFLPPDSALGAVPKPGADLYSLGRLIKILLGDALSPRQSAVVEQLLSSSPRERPPLVEVAVAFGVQEGVALSEPARDINAPTGPSGRVVKPTTVHRAERVVAKAAQPIPANEIAKDGRANRNKLTTIGLAGVLGLCVCGYMLKTKRPELYYDIVSYVPFLVTDHSLEYEEGWASGERARMAIVGRAAVIRKEPAAINAVVNDLLSGSNPTGIKAALVRIALSDLWRDQLSSSDISTAVALGLDQLVPEGISKLPALESLHPALMLAVLGQPYESPQLRSIAKVPVAKLETLPEPFGPLFTQLRTMGVSEVGDPRVRGLARIACGDSKGAAYELYLGEEQAGEAVVAKIGLILPVVAGNPNTVSELYGVLQDRGGEVGLLLSWFDLLELPRWSSVPPIDRLRLLVGAQPQARLDDTQWSDLLSFPVSSVRAQAIKELKRAFPDPQGERLLLTLASPSITLKREETIALVSALKLPADKRQPFIGAWFNLQPSADAVLLLLLARSGASESDLFNLEAARYLRKASWKAPLEIVTLLAAHPEPLARAIAYGRLDPAVEAEKSVLLARKEVEKEPGCVKILQERLKG